MNAVEIIAYLPPLGWVALAIAVLAAFFLSAELVERTSSKGRKSRVHGHAKDMAESLSGLKGQIDDQKAEIALLNEHVQFFIQTLGLDTFPSDEARRQFIEAAGTFSREGDLKPLLEAKGIAPHDIGGAALGMNPDEAKVMMLLQQDWSAEGLARISGRLQERMTAVAELESAISAAQKGKETDIQSLLRANTWIFEPDFVMGDGRIWVDKTIDTVTAEINAGAPASRLRQRPDIIAEPVTDFSLQSNHQWTKQGRRSVMVIDLKPADTQINAAHQTQVWEYVRELIRHGKIDEHEPVDCYVIGGHIDEFGGPRVEGRFHNVRIVATTYEQLLGRAKRLTLNLYDELKTIAPALAQAEPVAEAAAAEAAMSEEHDAHAEGLNESQDAGAQDHDQEAHGPADHHDEHHDNQHGDHHDDHHEGEGGGHEDAGNGHDNQPQDPHTKKAAAGQPHRPAEPAPQAPQQGGGPSRKRRMIA